MWEFPHVAIGLCESIVDAAARFLADDLGIKAKLGKELLTIRHSVTRFRITMVCLEAIYRARTLDSSYYRESRWLEPVELHNYPVSTPQRRLAEELSKTTRPLRLF